MFIKTFKVKKNTGAVIIGAVFVALAAVLILIGRAKSGKGDIYTLKTEADRQAFISQMGWEVGKEYDECKVVLIPEKWNDVYKKYNELQKEQGFDLEMLEAVSNAVNVPVIASGGAGKIEDFITLFQTLPKVDAGLAASIFHFGEVKIADLKAAMAKAGINTRV